MGGGRGRARPKGGWIDQGLFHLSIEPVRLVALVRDVVSALATRQHQVLVRASEEVVVAADPARVRQCIENLVSNAIKHSPSAAPVLVNITRERTASGALARVEVIDEGPGIAPELHAKMFDRFVSGDRKQGGLGLGLHLAKRIALSHGGELTVDSTPGRGARFSLTLPCVES